MRCPNKQTRRNNMTAPKRKPTITATHKQDLKHIEAELLKAKEEYDLCDQGFAKVIDRINAGISGPDIECKVTTRVRVSGYFSFEMDDVEVVPSEYYGLAELSDEDAMNELIEKAVKSLPGAEYVEACLDDIEVLGS
jgi:hypothetical protein